MDRGHVSRRRRPRGPAGRGPRGHAPGGSPLFSVGWFSYLDEGFYYLIIAYLVAWALTCIYYASKLTYIKVCRGRGRGRGSGRGRDIDGPRSQAVTATATGGHSQGRRSQERQK